MDDRVTVIVAPGHSVEANDPDLNVPVGNSVAFCKWIAFAPGDALQMTSADAQRLAALGYVKPT